jgi:hypothetical protein
MTGSGMQNIEPIPPLKGDVGLRRTWMVEETFAHPAKSRTRVYAIRMGGTNVSQ